MSAVALRAVASGLVAVCMVVPAAIHADEAQAAPGQSSEAAESAGSEGYLVEGSRLTEGLGRGAALTLDVLILRPVAALATGAGFALFLPAALFSYPSEGRDGANEAWRIFVEPQATQVYERPLGDFS